MWNKKRESEGEQEENQDITIKISLSIYQYTWDRRRVGESINDKHSATCHST